LNGEREDDINIVKFVLFTLSELKVKEGGFRINLLKFMSDLLAVID